MKFIITESKLTEILQKFVDRIKYDEVCKFIVDYEQEADDEVWIYAIISENWYLYEKNHQPMNKVAIVNKIRREVREEIKNFFGIDVRVESYVNKCKL